LQQKIQNQGNLWKPTWTIVSHIILHSRTCISR
jgi:hypothetical protein